MSITLHVVKPELPNTAKTLERNLDSLEEALERVRVAVASLDRMWEGDAHNKFMAQYTRYRGLDQQLVRTVRQYIADLRKAGKAYSETDSECARLIRNA